MKERYKYEFMKYLYNKLDLKNIENKIIEQEIVNIDEDVVGLYKDISKYFSLVNNVDESMLPEQMKQQYNYYFSMNGDELENRKLKKELNNFLESTYKYLLYPNINEKFCFYGPLNYKYVAPRDAIVLGFNYCEFNLEDENFDQIHLKKDEFICNILNYIQDELSNKTGLNIAVLKYNEYSIKKVK